METPFYCWKKESAPIRICFTKSPAPLPPHAQEALELMYFWDASGCQYQCAGKDYEMRSGDLAVVNTGEIHACRDWGERCYAVCLMIDLGRLGVPALCDARFMDKIALPSEMREVFFRLRRALTEETAGVRDCLVLGCVYEILAFLSRHTVRDADITQSGARKKELYAITRFIAQNPSEDLSARALAERMHLSEDRFYHAFKELFGISLGEYVLGERIAKACALLEGSALTVTAIAQECGFCTASYFAKRFGECMKMTPREYRARVKNEK